VERELVNEFEIVFKVSCNGFNGQLKRQSKSRGSLRRFEKPKIKIASSVQFFSYLIIYLP